MSPFPIASGPALGGGWGDLEAFGGPPQRPPLLRDAAGQTQTTGLGQGRITAEGPSGRRRRCRIHTKPEDPHPFHDLCAVIAVTNLRGHLARSVGSCCQNPSGCQAFRGLSRRDVVIHPACCRAAVALSPAAVRRLRFVRRACLSRGGIVRGEIAGVLAPASQGASRSMSPGRSRRKWRRPHRVAQQ